MRALEFRSGWRALRLAGAGRRGVLFAVRSEAHRAFVCRQRFLGRVARPRKLLRVDKVLGPAADVVP
eukprot:11207459-Lingulodinium_polyedra.AAC.1